MSIDLFKCPTCGSALPRTTKSNQLIECPACHATIMISDWRIGETKEAVVVETPTRIYTLANLITQDDLCNVYRCTFKTEGKEWNGLFRIALDPEDNDLIQNEAQTLSHFQSHMDYDKFSAFLPLLLESFLYRDAAVARPRQVNIVRLNEQIASPSEIYSLAEVREYYRAGIDPKDMAWMWRRLLNVLGFAHKSEVIHGAVLPQYVYIEPKDHKLLLLGWDFSVRAPASGALLRAVSVSYEEWYPPEVQTKKPPTPALDLHLAARLMLSLIGIDPLVKPDDIRHPTLPDALKRHFAQLLHPDPAKRPQNAFDVLDNFDRIIEQAWGPREFRVFRMPEKL